MKHLTLKFSAFAIMAALAMPSSAQDVKEKEKSKDVEQIIITKKGDDKEKVVIEIVGDKVTVNGKPSEDMKEGNIKVRRSKYKSTDVTLANIFPGAEAWSFNWNDRDQMGVFNGTDENRAMLGVVTEKVEQGAKVNEVTDESAAEKAGIKEGDIITKIGDAKIESPDVLSETVRKHKPGEKVNVTFLRDKKEQTVTAELGKWKGVSAFAIAPPMPDMRELEQTLPRIQRMPRTPYGQNYNFSWSDGAPKLGISVQDTEEGKGVKVIDVDEDSNAAKAGLKENDIITHINDKEVNSADEVAKLVSENKDKPSMQLKIKRAGKVQNVEVKMPRKLKTADL